MAASHPQRPGISLRAVLPQARFVGADDVLVAACASQAESCEPGDLFVAVAGTNGDGHEQIAEALARGARAVLVQRPQAGLRVPQCVVDDTRDALGRVCQALAGYPSRTLRVVGIAGSSGKTTTAHLTASVLMAGQYAAGLLGTLGYCDGLSSAAAIGSTPPAPVLADWLGRMAHNGCTHAVLEITRRALLQSHLAGVALDVACLTHVRGDFPDHRADCQGDRFDHERLFDLLSDEGVAVLNADDPASQTLLRRLDRPALTIGLHQAAEVTARIVEQSISDQTFLLCAGQESIAVRTRLIGTHNLYHCLMAAAVGLIYGLDLPTIARGLQGVDTIAGRLQSIQCGQPFSVFVDHARTVDALAVVLRALRHVTHRRLLCVFGASGQRDPLDRPRMGRLVERLADVAVVTSDNPGSEDPEAIIDQILAGFRQPRRAVTIADRAEAIHWALAEARPGDCVLIAGRGHESHQLVGRERVPFDDRQFAKQLLREGVGFTRTARAAA
jgi:UDP-N-acetylmuramoyl-L-alanyl-D-glutamate--2,6-diaminopimelate ligase